MIGGSRQGKGILRDRGRVHGMIGKAKMLEEEEFRVVVGLPF